MQFSTKDDDNDYHQGENCPKNSREVGGTEIVMGLILMVGTLADHTRLLLMVHVNWYTFRGYHYSFKRSEMKTKQKLMQAR